MEEASFTSLLSCIAASNIYDLAIDKNPEIPEVLFAHLLVEGENNLRMISLRANGITNIGARAIASNLKLNRTVASLNFWYNKIGKEGAESIADAMKVNTSVFSLSLAYNPIGDEGASSICKVLSNYLLPSDELASKKKIIAELEMQKMEVRVCLNLPIATTQDIGNAKKSAKQRVTNASGKKGKAKSAGAQEEDKSDPKKKSATKGAKGKADAAKPAALGKKGVATGSTTALDDSKRGVKASDKKGDKSVKGKKGEKAKAEEKGDEEDVRP